jgi:hypothetical protein
MTPPHHALALAASLPRGGGYRWPVADPGDGGCPTDLVHHGVRILRAGRGTYCCGLTFWIWWQAANRAGALAALSVADARAIQRAWFCIGTRKGPVAALVSRGLGVRVAPADALPGDFAQLWRKNGSGHSVMVERVAHGRIAYLSTQKSTGGIGSLSEPLPAETYVCRATFPDRPPNA